MRPAMERPTERDNRRPAGGDLGEFQCALDRLGATVRPKHLIELRWQRRSELNSRFHHRLVRKDVGLGVDNLGCLLLYRLDDAGVAVTRVDDRNSRREIEIPIPLHIPDVDAFASVRYERRITANHTRDELLRVERDRYHQHPPATKPGDFRRARRLTESIRVNSTCRPFSP